MSLEQRQEIIVMVDYARTKGARLNQACECVDIDAATYRRWQCNGKVLADQRATAVRPVPLSKLSVEERELILLTCHLPKFQSLPPSQIVPTLADLGEYIGSESSSIGYCVKPTNSMIVGVQSHDRREPNRMNFVPPALTSVGVGM